MASSATIATAQDSRLLVETMMRFPWLVLFGLALTAWIRLIQTIARNRQANPLARAGPAARESPH
jgi:hypothetical protein